MTTESSGSGIMRRSWLKSTVTTQETFGIQGLIDLTIDFSGYLYRLGD